MESDTDVGSEISFGSSHSSCEESSPTSLSAPVPFFIDPSNVQEFHNYLRTKQQSMILKLQIKSGVIFFGHVPCTFGDVQLTKFFSRYGRIVRVRVFHKVQKCRKARRKHDSAPGPRVAYMEFASADEAKLAVQAVHESPVYVKLFQCEFLEMEDVPSDAFHSVCDQRLGQVGVPATSSTSSGGRRDRTSRHRKSLIGRLDVIDSHLPAIMSPKKRKRTHSHHRSRNQSKRMRHSYNRTQ